MAALNMGGSRHSSSRIACRGNPAARGEGPRGRDLGLGDLVGVGSAPPASLGVDPHHDAVGLRRGLVEDRLQHLDDELHRRVVVVQQRDLVADRLPGLLAGLVEHAVAGTWIVRHTLAIRLWRRRRRQGGTAVGEPPVNPALRRDRQTPARRWRDGGLSVRGRRCAASGRGRIQPKNVSCSGRNRGIRAIRAVLRAAAGPFRRAAEFRRGLRPGAAPRAPGRGHSKIPLPCQRLRAASPMPT